MYLFLMLHTDVHYLCENGRYVFVSNDANGISGDAKKHCWYIPVYLLVVSDHFDLKYFDIDDLMNQVTL